VLVVNEGRKEFRGLASKNASQVEVGLHGYPRLGRKKELGKCSVNIFVQKESPSVDI
jgi:hypothetical protein